MFPFLKYLETSVKKTVLRNFGTGNRKTRMQWCDILPRPIEAGNPRQNQLKIPSTASKTLETRVRRLREL